MLHPMSKIRPIQLYCIIPRDIKSKRRMKNVTDVTINREEGENLHKTKEKCNHFQGFIEHGFKPIFNQCSASIPPENIRKP